MLTKRGEKKCVAWEYKLSSDGDGSLSELSLFPLPLFWEGWGGHQSILGGIPYKPKETEAILIVTFTLPSHCRYLVRCWSISLAFPFSGLFFS